MKKLKIKEEIPKAAPVARNIGSTLPEGLQQYRTLPIKYDLFFCFDGVPQYLVQNEDHLKKIRVAALQENVCNRVTFIYNKEQVFTLTDQGNLQGDSLRELYREIGDLGTDLLHLQMAARRNGR